MRNASNISARDPSHKNVCDIYEDVLTNLHIALQLVMHTFTQAHAKEWSGCAVPYYTQASLDEHDPSVGE